jgi:hypothetical protein
MRVAGAFANGIGLLALGTQSNPTPLFGGTAVPLPAYFLDAIVFDVQGIWHAEGALEAPPLPLGDVFAQVAWFAPALPSGIGLTNALQLTLQ